tara:strand:+ start:1738 stop:2769 length:1032 start_codon:yes stop_codon:yes gene_type:complete
MTTSVVILNWNGVAHLNTYLPSVVESAVSDSYKVYVIDNGSEDNSVAWLSENFNEIEVIALDQNYGFAGGYNRGLKKIVSDRFVLLNSDVRVDKGWVTTVNKCMSENDWKVSAPLILDDKNPDWYDYAGAAGGFIDKDGFVFCAGRVFNSFEKADNKYRTDREVFWASGAALFIDSEIWNEVGGLDADLFAHMEEIDLCWRLKNRGYKVGVCGGASVRHLGGGTLASSSPFKVFLNFRNNLIILLKNKDGCVPLCIYRRLILDGVAAFRFLFRGEVSFFFAVAQAHFSFFFTLPSTLKKRNLEKTHRKMFKANLVGMYSKSILIQYFFKGIHNMNELSRSDFK